MPFPARDRHNGSDFNKRQRNGDESHMKSDRRDKPRGNDQTNLQKNAIAEGPPPEIEKKKFTGRCRLFVGNLTSETKEEDLRKLFEEHGEVSECYLSSKGFAFVRLDTRAHAEAAKEAVDGHIVPGNSRGMRVRFAVHGASIRLKELSPFVSNELLHQAFALFGTVERAVHVVDEKGRPTGEGIVEFERKPAALDALRKINEGVFLLSGSPKPIIAEPLEPKDEDDGLSERMIPHSTQFQREREQPPRFAVHGSFEHEFGGKWKELYQMEKMRKEQLNVELRQERERLDQDVDFAYQDYQAALIKEDLRRRQEELERLEQSRRERVEIMRRRDEQRGINVPQYGAPPPQFGNRGDGPPNRGGGFNRGAGFNEERGGRQERGDRQNNGPPPPAEHHQKPGGAGQKRGGDDNLVNGVQKLLQMFKGDPNTQQTQPGEQPPSQFAGGPPGGLLNGPPAEVLAGMDPRQQEMMKRQQQHEAMMQQMQGGPAPQGHDLFNMMQGGPPPHMQFPPGDPNFGNEQFMHRKRPRF